VLYEITLLTVNKLDESTVRMELNAPSLYRLVTTRQSGNKRLNEKISQTLYDCKKTCYNCLFVVYTSAYSRKFKI